MPGGTRGCNCGIVYLLLGDECPLFGPSPPASHRSQESRAGAALPLWTTLSDRLQIAIQIHHLSHPENLTWDRRAGGKGRPGRTGCNIKMGGEQGGRPITRGIAGAIACRALRDPWPPAHPPAPQPTTLHDRALACPPCCKPTATSRRCAASFDESQPRRGLPCSCRPALPCPPVPVCLCACVPGPEMGASTTREPAPLAHLAKRKAGIALLSGCIVPTPAPSLASASLRYQQPLYTLLPLL